MKTVNPLPFVDYVHAVCSDLKERGRVRSSETHEAMLRRFLEFSDNPKMLMSDLNAKMVEGYEAFLRIQHGVCRNTSSFYLRILRSVCGRAVKEGILPTDDFFRNVYTGVDKTTKRAISLSDIERIRNLDLTHEPAVALARDLFLFSFYMRGMSFIDMAYLTKCNLRDGFVSYVRRKTGRSICVKWEKEMQEIVDRYADPASPYLLPIITCPEKDVRKQYVYRLRDVNLKLKQVAQRAGLSVKLTTYVARHSWATAAREMEVPMSMISQGLGHEDEATTRIYLAALDASKVDQANAVILSALNKKKGRRKKKNK